MPTKYKPVARTEAHADETIITIRLPATVAAALNELGEREAARIGGNPDRLRSSIVRRLIIDEHKRTSDR